MTQQQDKSQAYALDPVSINSMENESLPGPIMAENSSPNSCSNISLGDDVASCTSNNATGGHCVASCEVLDEISSNSIKSDTGNHFTVNTSQTTEVENKMPSILPSAWLDLEAGSELIHGPVNNPERMSSPLPVYGPMNNASGDDFVTDRVSKDMKDAAATPGQCGLYNLGNTCFMNAGLQSLMATPPVIRYFLQHQTEAVGHSLVEQFSHFVSKFWSGQFSILYPKDLKTALGQIHGQFKDYRQHDCQEFLALLLDTLNDQTRVGPNTPFFITHNDLNNTHSQFLSSNDNEINERKKQRSPTTESMETSSERAEISVKEDDVRPMSLTELADSPDGELLEELHLNNTCLLKKKLPSIEKFYAKETKTLNTNVLVSESSEDSLNFDSAKYAKQENCPVVHNDIGVNHVINEPMVMIDLKRCRVSPKGVKDVNIYADMCNKNVNMYCDNYEDTEKVKRSKFDSFEKNFQHQAFSKLNCIQEKSNGCDSESQWTVAGEKLGKCADNVMEVKTHALPNGVNVENESEEPKTMLKTEFKQEQEVNQRESNDVDIDQDPDSVEAVEQEEEEEAEDNEQESSDKMEDDIGDGVWDDEKLLSLAQKRWTDHVVENQSVIVKTFHGQYKSSVKCNECSHVSVTFEPFMYLSVPLPRANERQLCVMYISMDNTPVQYLLTVDKQDRISKVKELLTKMTQTTNNIVMAEVLDHHVARIVDDSTWLRYVNSNTRKLYAFEMAPFQLTAGSENEAAPVASGVNSNHVPMDVFSHVGTFNTSEVYSDFGKEVSLAAASRKNDDFVESIVGASENSGWGNSPTLPYSWSGDDIKENETASATNNGSCDFTIGQWSLQDSNTPLEVDGVTSDLQWSSVTTLEEEDQQLTNNPGVSSQDTSKERVVTVDQWKSCSICLEELADPELLVHKTCGATFCHCCLEMSLAHYGQDNFLCPVCSCAAVMSEDFTQLADSDKKTEERMLMVDVTFCHTVQEQRNLIGHPHILYLSSQMQGAQLYESIEKIVPDASHFTLLMTDAQGSRCSRCVYTAKCTGCILPRDDHVSLRPGDTVCVCLDGLQQSVIERMELAVDHPSMMDLRPTLPLSIYDCIQAFTESEVLDKHNPWFCPRCQQNQCANKSMTVWRYPDVLIVHLKRFVYHDLVSVKVDSEVEFPLEGLNLSHHISGPVTCDLTYDLHSIVCHFGDLNSGHYTCFAKHAVDNTWYYYNDENVSQQSPKQEDFKNAYILMYHRRGADFAMPSLPSIRRAELD